MFGFKTGLRKRTSVLTALLSTIACIPETSETIEIGQPYPSQLDDNPNTSQNPNQSRRPQNSGGHRSPAAAPSNDDPAQVDTQPRQDSPVSQTNINQRLANWFSVKNNYDLVYRDVLKFFPDGRYNGCVAFLSAALRRLDVYIPIQTETESPSLVTRPFSRYLENSLGWRRIGGPENLRSGDIVFTTDNASYPGYPAHTYMFYEWSDRSTGIALVIDNQDFTHERNVLKGGAGFNFTPFAYALRAP